MMQPIHKTFALLIVLLMAGGACAQEKTRTENFDHDPGWEGVNNRIAAEYAPRQVRQDFGYSPTNHAGGKPGEMGGFISPAAEAAYYGMKIPDATLKDKLTVSGRLYVGKGHTHILIGLFNANTVNEWRTSNTISLRINGRGDRFFAYVEYCTSKWRAGGDSTPFPSTRDEHGRLQQIGFASDKSYEWTLTYDPNANGGKGLVTATIGDKTATCTLEEGRKADGATFNHVGLMDVMKSADEGSEIYIDNLTFNGKTENFDADPHWDGRNNRSDYLSRFVRPWFNFGYSRTHFAGGARPGEVGGVIFRGDCRYPDRMACYGDRIGPITLEKPFSASGKIAMTRGVTDSTTLFGFYNSHDSMRQTNSQANAIPESCLGINIEGPSSEGFFFYPVYRTHGGDTRAADSRHFSHLYPDGKSHTWALRYLPDGAGGKGQIAVTLDGTTKTFDLQPGDKARGTQFDRFGIVTTWIDGNSENVYWDDITYTVSQDSP